MTDEIAHDPQNKMTTWLSRGLVEARLDFIGSTPGGDGLRVCAYEFTYPRVFHALKDALARGVDVRIIYHKTLANAKAIQATALPETKGNVKVLIEQTRPKIPHNKFIVRLARNQTPVSVWTGSTDFTASGFLGQTNVGHKVTDGMTAKTYFRFWMGLSANPVGSDAIAAR